MDCCLVERPPVCASEPSASECSPGGYPLLSMRFTIKQLDIVSIHFSFALALRRLDDPAWQAGNGSLLVQLNSTQQLS